MKSIYDMTKEEVLGLSSESIATLIDFECAQQGIRLLPELPTAPVLSEISPDLDVYKVGDYAFTSMERIKDLLFVLTSGTLYKVDHPGNGDYSTNLLKPIEPSSYYYPKCETVKAFSEEKWQAIKKENSENAALQNTYIAARNNYDAILKERQTLVNDITELIETIRAEKRKYDFYVAEFYRYLELAEGNNNIAINFLTAAYKNLTEEFPELITELQTFTEKQPTPDE